jgi:hypothetical protein
MDTNYDKKRQQEVIDYLMLGGLPELCSLQRMKKKGYEE